MSKVEENLEDSFIVDFLNLRKKYLELIKIVKRAANNSCCLCCDSCLACDATELLHQLGETK